MPGNWLVTYPYRNDTLSSTATTQQVQSRDLPRANMIGRVTFKIHIVGVGTPTLTLDRIQVRASGSVTLWQTEGGQLRGINKYQSGTANNGVLVSTTDLVWVGTINFGRGFHDEDMIFPAKGFKSVQVEFTYTPGATTSVTTVGLSMIVDEFVTDDDPKSKLIRRVILEKTRAAAAGIGKLEISPGLPIRAIFVHFDDPDNVNANTPFYGGTVASASPIRVVVNGGSEIPYAAPADLIKASNQEVYGFDDADTPDSELSNAAVFTGTEEMVCLDFDPRDDLTEVLDSSRMNTLEVEVEGAASGTSGDVHVLTDAYMVL